MEIRAIWSYTDLTWCSNSVTRSSPKAFVDAAMYSSGMPSTMSTLASPRTRSALASVGVSPTSIVIATLGRDESAFTLGAGRRRADDDLVPVPVEPDRDHSREAVRSVVGEPEERRGVEQVPRTGMPKLFGDLLQVHDLPFLGCVSRIARRPERGRPGGPGDRVRRHSSPDGRPPRRRWRRRAGRRPDRAGDRGRRATGAGRR